MAEGVGCRGGGIADLLKLIDEHEGAALYDVLRHGYSEDDFYDAPDGRLSWRTLLTIIKYQEPGGGSAVYRALHPRSWGYNLQVQAIMSLRGDEWEVPSDDPRDIETPKQLPKPADIRARLKAVDAEIAARVTEAATGS